MGSQQLFGPFYENQNKTVVIIGTEKAIFRGLTDICDSDRIPCFAPVIEAAQLEENRIFAKNLVRQVRPEMVCPFSAVHDISTAEAFIKQPGSSIVLKGSSAVLEFELQVFRDDAQGLRLRLLKAPSLLVPH